MNILLIPNLGKKNAYECTCEVLSHLIDYSCCPYLQEEYAMCFPSASFTVYKEQEHKTQIDMIISIGGDGTMIHSARYAVLIDRPVLGINAGRLGFLTEIESTAIHQLQAVVNGEYSIQERMMLHATLIHKGETQEFQAINDIVISKGELAKVVDIDVEMQNGYINYYRADGLIFSTPTGSTAYALSAGGPIIYSAMDTIMITPICPHSLFSRAILYEPGEIFHVKGRYVNNSEILYMTVDGENAVKVDCHDKIIISKDPKTAKFVNFGSKSYYEKLNKKILGRG